MQPSGMEIDMNAPGATELRKHATIMDIATLLDKGICILDPNRFMWYKPNKTMISMLRGQRIRRTLMKRKSGLLRQGLSFCF
jgi:hypothetical protein